MHFCNLYLFTWLIAGVLAASSNISASVCDALSSALPGNVFFPENEKYNASILSYPFIQLRLQPTCVVRPETVEHVSTAITILTQNKRTRFSVKGGGHNANAGFSNIQDGVTIDMQSIKAVELELGNQVVRVGAGALSQDVYDVVEKRNLSALAGRIGVVGIAGFTTGGGVSFLSPEHGWACDSVVNFEVVLASGELVNANTSSKPDLYAALKGGQNNFGIVTRFDLKVYPQGPIWGGRVVYAPEADIALLSAFTEFKNPEKFDPYAAGWVTISYNHTATKFTPISIMWYTKPELKPGALKRITEIEPKVMNGIATAYPSEHTRNASRAVTATSRYTIWATSTFRISPTIVHRIYSLWKDFAPEICETFAYTNPTAELTFQSLPPISKNGMHPNSLGFAPDSKPETNLVFLEVLFMFDDGKASEGLYKGLKDFIEKFEELAEEEGVKHDFKYMNFAAWFQDPLGGYGKEQKKELREVARKYDPEAVFQKQVTGGFKLF